MKYYCGPDFLPERLRKILSSNFNASCRVHDMDYTSGKFTRTEADLRFKKNALRQADNRKILRLVAIIFYIAVRVGGRFSYRFSSKK